eukprot:TRINITY_DN12674_c0_g2_i1.p1 TRINITY_DN12674_c0_g2~~TRINITY_DN12674_c0_g2_i1.p1  ORF type:complete len:569 (-),score=70.23 TRINITY_DN12674_c0_g2_i1:396-1895(-)
MEQFEMLDATLDSEHPRHVLRLCRRSVSLVAILALVFGVAWALAPQNPMQLHKSQQLDYERMDAERSVSPNMQPKLQHEPRPKLRPEPPLDSVCSSIGCDKPFVGVNLGGWLLLEGWMWSEEMESKGLADEWSLIKHHGGPRSHRAISLMHEHWDTFLTSKHLDQLQDFGITHVRIPVGYWLVDYDSADGYVDGGKYFLHRGLKWLKERGMRAVIDMHALPGAQAATAVWSGREERNASFFIKRKHNERGRHAMLRLARLIHSFEEDEQVSGVVFGMELMNEPDFAFWDTPRGIRETYEDMIPEIRRILPADTYMLLLNFQEFPRMVWSVDWLSQIRRHSKDFRNVVYDVHMYHGYGDDGRRGIHWSVHKDSCKTCCRDPKLLHPLSHKNVPMVIGEYSLNTDNFVDDDFRKQFWHNQLSLWTNTPGMVGSFFWNFRILPAPHDYYSEMSLIDLMDSNGGPLPAPHTLELAKLCGQHDLTRCPHFDLENVTPISDCNWK